MEKKLLSMFLALMMIISVCPVRVLAAEDKEKEKTVILDDADYLKESKNGNWIDINDPEMIKCKYVNGALQATCQVKNFKKIYQPYREPEEILMNDLGFSAEDAEQILNGTSTNTRVAHICTEADLKSRFSNPNGADILVLKSDIVLTSELVTHVPFTILAAEPYTIKGSYADTIEHPTMFTFGYNNSLPMSNDSKIRFSNVILDGNNVSCALYVITEIGSQNMSSDTAPILEGACIVNGRETSPVIDSLGGITCKGCTVVSCSDGICVENNRKDVSISDCNIFCYNPNGSGIDISNPYGAKVDIKNSYIGSGISFGDSSFVEDKSGTLDITNTVIAGGSNIYNTSKFTVKNSKACSLDLTNFIGKRDVLIKRYVGQQQIGFMGLADSSDISIEDTAFDSGMVAIDMKMNEESKVSITHSSLIWSLPIDDAAKNELEKYEDEIAGVYVYTHEGSNDAVSITESTIAGYPTGISFDTPVVIKDCEIQNNEYGIRRNQYKPLQESYAEILSTTIQDNSIAGILVNKADITLNASTIMGNGNKDNKEAGGFVVSVPESFGTEESCNDQNGSLIIVKTNFQENKTMANGGAIRIEDPSVPVSIMDSEFIANTSVGSGGAISLPNYSKLTVDSQTVFEENMAQAAYYPPENANELYSSIQFATASICEHPLNNYDISYVGEKQIPEIVSVVTVKGFSVEFGTSTENIQKKLETEYTQIQVELNTGEMKETAIIWKVAESEYDSQTAEIYTICGELKLPETWEFVNSSRHMAKVEIEVLPQPDPKLIIDYFEPSYMTVKKYTMIANEDNKTTEFGPPTILQNQKLPEKVTAHLMGGEIAELPVKWNIRDYDSAKSGTQVFTGEPILPADSGITNGQNEQKKEPSLEITVQDCDYLFMDATVSDISLEVLPGTTVEELNDILKEKKWELPLYIFDLESEDQVVTFYRPSLKEEYCSEYQMDVPGKYEIIIPWPEDILPSEEEGMPDIKVIVRVSEPLKIIGVSTETISPYQSVPVGHEKFPIAPSQVNAILEGGMEIPIDVEWDWTPYNEDLAANQMIDGKLINLPSKAKQPEGKEFRGKLSVCVVPVEYKITALLSDDALEADAGLTLEEITQILQPTLTFQISGATDEGSLSLERTVAVLLEDERNPQFTPWDIYGDFVTGTLLLPDNITFDPNEEFDQIPLITDAAKILSFEPGNVIAREGTEFVEILNKPDTVIAKLSTIGSDGKNKKVSLSVDWGTGEGYMPYPPDITDDTPVEIEITGKLVNKPMYIAASDKKPVLIVSVGREFDIEEILPGRLPETGELEVPLGSSVEDIYHMLEQHTVQLTLKSTNNILSTKDVTYKLCPNVNSNYNPKVLGSTTLTATLLHDGSIKNPKDLKLEIHVKTMSYDIATAKVVTIKGIAKGTAFTDLPLPETAGAVREDGETEMLPTTWDDSKYNPEKKGGQFINGTFNTPLPLHLNNPDNRQPKAYITIVDTAATVLSMEQVFDEPTGARKVKAKTEEVPGYVEHKYLVKYQYQDGSIKEEVISLYSEEE